MTGGQQANLNESLHDYNDYGMNKFIISKNVRQSFNTVA